MMLDIAAARQGFRNRTVIYVGFVRSFDNFADGLTKRMQQKPSQTVIEEWFLRASPEPRIRGK